MSSPTRAAMRHCFSIVLLIFGLWAPAAYASYQTINNDSWWISTSGAPIYAQSGYISKIGNTYYWWGVEYKSAPTYESNGGGGQSLSFVAVNCYTSTDLAHWTFQSQALTPTGADVSSNKVSYIGRLGAVFYNSTSNQWVMWIVYQSTVTGDGEMCATSSSPLGPFTFNNVQTTFTNVFDSTNGDSTIFLDSANGGTPYFIYSDAHGREHAYISPLGSNYLSIGAATLISEWPQGQESNDMFWRNGRYYYCMSNLAGWSYSSAYQVNSASILPASGYTPDATFVGTDINSTYYSQITMGLPVVGDVATTYIMVCDRWSELDSSYTSAGHGVGYEVWEPLTWNGAIPTFLPLSSYQLDAVTGNWRPLPAFAAPTGLTATPGNNQVALSWDASGSATGYTVQSGTTPGGPYTIIASGTTTTVYTDTTPINGTTYYYEVAAVSGTAATSSTSAYTLPVSAIPSVNAAPAAPGELAATTGTSQVALSWDPAVSATSYIIERATASSGPYIQIATGATPVYSDTNATYGPTYYYEIASVNGNGTSTNSPPVSANLTGNISWTGTANGAWDTTTTNWLFGATNPALYEDGDTVVFPDASATTSITISSPVSPAAMTFTNSSASYTVGGASLSGTGGLTQNGTGTLTLTGSNNYLGNTTPGSGATLIVGNANALQSSTLDLSHGTLNFGSATTAATFGGLQGTNAAQNLALASAAGPVALTVGGNNSTTTYSGNLSGAGSVAKSGTGKLTLSNANFTGNLTVGVANAAGNVSGALTINGGTYGSSSSVLTIASDDTVLALIMGGGTATYGTLNIGPAGGETGSSMEITGGIDSFTNTTIGGAGALNTAGALQINTTGSVSLGALSVVRDELNTNSAEGLLIQAGTVTAATVSVGASVSSHTADITISGGSFTIGTSSSTGDFKVGTTNNGNNLTLTGGSLTYLGTDGLLATTGATTTSTITISGGTAMLTGITLNTTNSATAVSTLTLNSNTSAATLYLGSVGLVVNAPAGSTVSASFGTAKVGALAPWTSSAPITLTGVTTFQTANASGTPENITLSGSLSGTGGLTQTGGGTLTLSGDNTYAGATNVINGVLQLTGSLSSTSSLTIANGAAFYLAGGSLSVSGGVTNNGIFKISGTPALTQTGSFINNGVLDLINGSQTLPSNFTNSGTVLNSSSVQVQQLAMSGSNFTLTIQGYAQHKYQLQSATSLVAPVTWTNVGAAQVGMGTPLIFTDPSPAAGQGFYQVQVSP